MALPMTRTPDARHRRPPPSVLRSLLQSEAAGGLVLIGAAAVAMFVANSPLAPAYLATLKLEAGGLPLEQAIALYEEGMTLARECQERLDEAELKITKLKESFAPLPERANGRSLNDEPADYEYVADDELPNEEDDPFT